MTVSDIFGTETPKLINLFFEKFEGPEEENSGFVSVEEDEEKNSQEEKKSEKSENSEKSDKEEEEPEETKEEEPKKEKDVITDGRQILDYLFSYLY